MGKFSFKALFGGAGAAQSAPAAGADGEQIAAIALALNMYSEEVKGRSNSVPLIGQRTQPRSEWNSKVFGLSVTPNKK